RSRWPRCAPDFLISEQTVRRRHLRHARHPDVPARNDPLTARKLPELDTPGRSRYPQRNRKIDVIKIEIPERICFWIQPENPGQLGLRANLGRSELESG